MTGSDTINPRDIPGELLEKYNRSGPRYTSYPTAPQFKTDFDPETLKTLWAETNTGGNGLSLYTHFPFCRSRCLYCGCFTHTGVSPETQKRYIEALKREAEYLFSFIDTSRSVSQFAFGGGSPTHLPVDFLADYLARLSQLVSFSPDAEFSIEIDPRSVDEDYLGALLALGFNRFSFGVQDLDPTVQKNIGRVVDEQWLKSLISYLKGRGVDAVNLDLIYGLPGQSTTSFSATIEKIVALHPSRIALFGYAHVPWVSPHQKKMEKYSFPTPAERMQLFGTAFHLLHEAGYAHVGMDHFALPHDELIRALQSRTLTRNFMGYTTRRGLDLVGIGASSISSVGKTYAQNQKDLNTYCTHSNGSVWQKGLVMTPEDILRREIILDLFCNFYLDTASVEERFDLCFPDYFSRELEALRSMENDGLLHIRENELAVTPQGRFFIRNICMTFDLYLEKENPEKRYSKTL